MQDPFARLTAQHAHQRLTRLEAELQQAFKRAERAAGQRSVFQRRCFLCGDPVRKGSLYCHAHRWAEER